MSRMKFTMLLIPKIFRIVQLQNKSSEITEIEFETLFHNENAN